MRKKDKQKNKSIDKENNNIYDFNKCYEKLFNEIKNFKAKNFRKESKKSFKTIYFTKYIESIDYSLINSNISFLWSNNIFLEKFLSELELYPDLIEPLEKIVEVLCGNFSNSKKIQKMQKYLKTYEYESNIYLKQKLCSFYSIKLLNNKKQILFCICLKTDENSNSKTVSSFIYFLAITEEWNIEKESIDFIQNNILSDDENFPYMEFEKSGFFIAKDLLFNNKKINDIEICFPIKSITVENNTIFKFDIIPDKKKELKPIRNYPEEFISPDINDSIISQLETEENEKIIKDVINGNIWGDIQLSNQEKEIIYSYQPFIISGKPGTGKTTVILVKLFATYYNFFLKKIKRLEDCKIEKKKKDNNNNKNKKFEVNQLRVVFTSFSQELCKEQMKSFTQMVKNVNPIKSEELSENYFYSNDELNSFKYKEVSENIIKKEIFSFRDINSYPIFTNFRNIMFLIDGSLTFQFFKRIKELRKMKNQDDSVFYYDKEKEYECNNYIISSQDNYKNNFMNFFYRSPELNRDNETIIMKESNENTFDDFYNNYLKNKTDLSKKLVNLNLNSREIYAQYISIIKGSFTSHLYPNNCITLEEYKKKGKRITESLSLEIVYEICMEYEDYKRKSNFFDIQDLTNFLIRQVIIEFKSVKLIDYIFIDEIQDLTVSQIFLLILVSKYCKIYAGDTCQTISKINRFRFSDLNNIFYNFQKILSDFESVDTGNLTINYRLNSKIMCLSNYMAYFIKECFPNTIDNFQNDFSIKVIDYKPMIISNIDTLFSIFNDETANLRTNLTLSSFHCFICRDKDTKKELSKRKVLPRTIEESKGLEYEIIIVYNFFSSSKHFSLWDELFREENLSESNTIKGYDTIIYEIKETLLKENMNNLINSLGIKQLYEEMDEDEDGSKMRQKILKELEKMRYPSLKKEFDIHSNFEFCSELKEFYVIITRPRTFLLFYEEKDMTTFSFFNRMIKNGIIKDSRIQDNYSYIGEIMNYFEKNNLICNDKKDIKKLGDKMMIQGRYEDAEYFYGKAEEENYQKKARIYLNYRILKEGKRNSNISLEESNKLNNNILDNIKYLKTIKPVIFEDEENIEGFCYLNLGQYEKAIEFYLNKKLYNEVGNIYYNQLKNYDKSFEYYAKAKNIFNAVDSLIKSEKKNKLIILFKYINKNDNYIEIGLSDYYNIYKEYVNNLFAIFYLKKRTVQNIFNEENDIQIENEELIEEEKNNKVNQLKKDNNNDIKNKINNIQLNLNNELNKKEKKRKKKAIFHRKNININYEENNELEEDEELEEGEEENENKIINEDEKMEKENINDDILERDNIIEEKKSMEKNDKEQDKKEEINVIKVEDIDLFLDFGNNWIRNYINYNENNKLMGILNISDLKDSIKNISNYNLIKEVIGNYNKNINLFEKLKEGNDDINNNHQLTKQDIIDFENEFELPELTNNFIECYYFKDRNFVIKEIMKCMPEIYYYKTKEFKKSSNNIKYLMKLMKDSNYRIYSNIINITKKFIYKANLSNDNDNIMNILCPLFYLNGFYDIFKVFYSSIQYGDYYYNEMMIGLTLSNIKSDENIYMNFNYLLYYLNYKLRYCLTIFLKTGKMMFENEKVFIKYRSQFARLFNLIIKIKNKEFSDTISRINIEDVNKLVEFIENNQTNNITINEQNIYEILELFEITSYISLYLFQLYIDNNSSQNFDILIEKNQKDFHNILLSLYKFSLLFNNVNISLPYYKKILIFSLFNIFCISPFPDDKPFDVYKSTNCSLLNINTILFSKDLEGTKLDIFSDKNDFIYSENNKKISIFDTNGNNLLISNEILYQIFRLLLSKYVNILYEKNISNLLKPEDPFSQNYKFTGKENLYLDILYYFNYLNYKIINLDDKEKLYIGEDIFWKETFDNYNNGFNIYDPFDNYNYGFTIYKYLIGFFFNSINSPQILLNFIEECNDRNCLKEEKKYLNNSIFILFNFMKLYFVKFDFSQYQNKLNFDNLEIDSKSIEPSYYELMKIFEYIQKNESSPIVSLLFLRRFLPYILQIISEITKKEVYIIFYINETLFDAGLKPLKLNIDIDKKFELLRNYLDSLKQLLIYFTLNGNQFSHIFKDYEFDPENMTENTNNLFYNKTINKMMTNINDNYEKELRDDYDINKNKIFIDYNWNFHLFELLFHCFYLTFADCLHEKDIQNDLYEIINEFLDYYECNDYYFNFINQQGAYFNISRIIEKNVNSEFDYKSFNEKFSLRNELIKSSKYDYISKEIINEIKFEKINSRNFFLMMQNDDYNNNNIFVINKKCDSLFAKNKNYQFNRFMFEEYDNTKSSSIDDYYRDLINLFPNNL